MTKMIGFVSLQEVIWYILVTWLSYYLLSVNANINSSIKPITILFKGLSIN